MAATRRDFLAWTAAALAAAPGLAGAQARPRLDTFVKGGNVSAWNIGNAAKVFADADRLGLDTITVPVRVAMPSATASSATVDAASLAFAKALVAARPNFRWIVEPYPWIAGGNVPETDLDPADKAAWFAAYQRAVVAIAREFPSAAGLYVASNLVKVEGESARWLALIREVRTAFAGRLLYRTQWWVTASWAPDTLAAYKAKLANPIFGAVDVIAVAAYFELSDVPAPSLAQLKSALRSTTVFGREQDVFAEVMAFQAKWGKPIFLGELSCPGVDLGAQNPWDPAVTTTRNPDIQQRYLAAWLETFAAPPAKFLGFSVFTIGHPQPHPFELAPSAAAYVRSYRAP